MKKNVVLAVLIGTVLMICCACGSKTESAMGEEANEEAKEKTGQTVDEIAEAAAAEAEGSSAQSNKDAAEDVVITVFANDDLPESAAKTAVQTLYDETDFGRCKGVTYLDTQDNVKEYTMTDYDDTAYILRIDAKDGSLIAILDGDGNIIYEE